MALLLLLLASNAAAQSSTNVATLTASLSGTNLLVTYSLATNHGWVTLYAAGTLDALPAQTVPLDLAPVPPAGLSLYEEDVADVLTSRGIPLNGVADFTTNLPVAIGPVQTPDARNFGSGHPNVQPAVNSYGAVSANRNAYTTTNAGTTCVSYQFYKHSKLGPCDEVQLTDGTFAPDGSYNNDGTYYYAATDRELGNLIFLAPGDTIRWRNMRKRCDNEATGYYVEDVRAFGFRVIKAVPNGFSFTVSALSETSTHKTYQLSVVDPSEGLGVASASSRRVERLPASIPSGSQAFAKLEASSPARTDAGATAMGAVYSWSFTNHLGAAEMAAGPIVQYTAQKDEPFTLHITRTRSGQTDTLTLRERGSDLDRNGGNAFVRNLVP